MKKYEQAIDPIARLTAFDPDSNALFAVIESPKGCRNKYKFNERTGLFELHKALAMGMSFPFDFGFIPATMAGDGDPIDVLVLMDQPVFTGCVARVRLIGVIKAIQRDSADLPWQQNDRLIAVSEVSHTHHNLHDISDLDPKLLDELEHFFVAYNDAQGKEFKPQGRKSKKEAIELVELACKAAKKRNPKGRSSRNAKKAKSKKT